MGMIAVYKVFLGILMYHLIFCEICVSSYIVIN